MAVAIAVVAVAGVWALRPETRTSIPSPGPATFRTVTGPYSAAFDFVTPSLGWALLTDYGSLSPARFFVFKTTDGAGHWQKQFAGQLVGDLTYLHFLDARNGFLYVGPPYRTVDGGAHWQQVDVPGPVSSVSFASPTTGWAEVFAPQGYASFYRTVDGGKTWAEEGPAPPESEVLEPHVGQPSRFRENGEGWLGAVRQPAPTVFVTADGGKTWHTVELFPTFESDYYDTMVSLIPGAVVAFVSNGTGQILGPFLSRDGGSSWQGAAILPFDGLVSADQLTFVDADHWWLFDSGSVYTTDDGGSSWLYLHVSAFPSESWRSSNVRAIDQTHAWWALTSTSNSEIGALAMTSDGGEHWSMVNAPQP